MLHYFAWLQGHIFSLRRQPDPLHKRQNTERVKKRGPLYLQSTSLRIMACEYFELLEQKDPAHLYQRNYQRNHLWRWLLYFLGKANGLCQYIFAITPELVLSLITVSMSSKKPWYYHVVWLEEEVIEEYRERDDQEESLFWYLRQNEVWMIYEVLPIPYKLWKFF